MATSPQLNKFIQDAERSYQGSFSAFDREAQKGGATTLGLRAGGSCFSASHRHVSGSDRVEVQGALKIERLPRRRRETNPSAQGRINVLLSSRDVYGFIGPPSIHTKQLRESYVSVAYYVQKKAIWQTKLAIHYDYNQRGATQAHPIFHAQLGNGALGKNLVSLAGVPSVIEEIVDPLSTVRLPTAGMIGATALLKLAADHLSHSSFLVVLDSLRKPAFFKHWSCDHTTLDIPPHPPNAVGWYSTKT